MHIKSWARTDIGQKRAHNEDAYLRVDDISLYMVADGMGGHMAGDIAANMAVSSLHEYIRFKMSQSQKPSDISIQEILHEAMNKACYDIHQKSLKIAGSIGMGTTASVVLIYQKKAFIAHVGDSRIYLLRKNLLTQITSDHSLVNEQVQAGLITQIQADNSRFKNIITRSLGFNDRVQADVDMVEIDQDDLFLICSDGLSNMLNNSEIQQIIENDDTEDACQNLVNRANYNGGDDNITVVLIKCLA